MTSPSSSPRPIVLVDTGNVTFTWDRDAVVDRAAFASTSLLVHTLRRGPGLTPDTNPPSLLGTLRDELARRHAAGEWIPQLTDQERLQWLTK